MSSHTDSLKNIIENRKAINSKILNVLASEEKFMNANYPANFKAFDKQRRFERFQEERPDFGNKFRGSRRFFSRNPPASFFRFSKRYPKGYRRPFKYSAESFSRRGPFAENFCPKKWKNKKYAFEESYPMQDFNYENFNDDWNENEDFEISNDTPKVKDPVDTSLNGVSYSLDRDTQHTIHRIQNDFRMTEKYRAFVLHEVPLIDDFRPVPTVTGNKMNDRFKCFFSQILDENQQTYETNEENDANNLPDQPDDDTLEICANLTDEVNPNPSKALSI